MMPSTFGEMTALSNLKWPSSVAIVVAVACTAAPPRQPSETAHETPRATPVEVAQVDAGADALDAQAQPPLFEPCAPPPPADAKGCELFAKMNRSALRKIKPISDA